PRQAGSNRPQADDRPTHKAQAEFLDVRSSETLMPDPRTIALDATYSVGDHLSGVGVYSREILLGLAAAHPEAGFKFCYRPHRFARSWREKLPRNCHRFFLQEPILPRRADIFHGLNQRLPTLRLRRT